MGKRLLAAASVSAAFFGCAPSGPHGDGPAIGRTAQASILPPTANGMDAPVLGPVRQALSSRAAFDGENFLVVWDDDRGAVRSVSAARVSRSGVLLDPEDIALPAYDRYRQSPTVAFGGTDYLIVWQEAISSINRIRGLRVGKDGRVIGAPFSVSADSPISDCQRPAVAFDGTNYLVAWHYFPSSYDQLYGARVSPLGVVLDKPAVSLVATQASSIYALDPPGLAFGGGNYLVGWSEGGKILTSRFSPALVRLDSAGVEVATGTDSYGPALAWDGTQFWAAFSAQGTGSSTAMVRRVSAAGVPLGQTETLATDASDNYLTPAVAGDGNGGLAIFGRGPRVDTDLAASLLDSASGTVSTTQSLVATVDSQWDPALTRGDATTPFLVSWLDTRHGGSAVYGSRLDASRLTMDGTGVLLSFALNKENEPAVAASAAGFLVAWIDSRDGGYNVYAADLDGTGAPLHAAARAVTPGSLRHGEVAVASDGTKYFAAWDESDILGNYSTLGRIIGADGTPETAPVVISPGSTLFDPVIAFGGGNYFVIGSHYVASAWPLSGARVSASGALLDQVPLPLAADAFLPAMASDGTDFLIVWRSGSAALGLRVDSNGVAKDSSPFTISPAGANVGSYPKVAFGGGSYFVVWTDPSSLTTIRGARVSPAGAVLDTTPVTIVPAGTLPKLEIPGDPSVGFDGSSFMVAWKSSVYDSGTSQVVSNDFKVTPVSPAGAVGAPSYVGPNDNSNSATADYPVVAATVAGTTIVAYVQRDNPAGYDIERVRTKSFTVGSRLLGAACAVKSDCASGNCIDGVCCDSMCGGGAADCTACSVIAGAPKNGVCATFVDGHSCGRAGMCAAAVCVEPPEDAGSAGAGGIPGTGGAAGASGGTGGSSNSGGAGGAAGSGGVPTDGAAPLVDGGGATSVGGSGTDAAPSTGGISASGSGGRSPSGTAGNGAPNSIPDAASGANPAPAQSEDSSGCGCKTARTTEPPFPMAALVATLSAVLMRRRKVNGCIRA